MANIKPTKKDHTDVGGTQVPNDMIKQEEAKIGDLRSIELYKSKPNGKEETALAVNDQQMIAEIRALSNTTDAVKNSFPVLKLQHTTTPDGEPSPLRGHFTVARMNDMGEWDVEDLGETFKMKFLMQRYFLKMMKGDDMYSSGEFETEMDIVALWKRNGDQSALVKEGIPHELQKMFLEKNDRDQLFSKLQKLSKLYVLVNGELVVWKLSLTGTIAWSKYNKLVPFAAGVVTAVGRTEEKKGTVKYYAPVFKAEERLTDLAEVKANIEMLRNMLPKKTNDSFVEVDSEDVPFK